MLLYSNPIQHVTVALIVSLAMILLQYDAWKLWPEGIELMPYWVLLHSWPHPGKVAHDLEKNFWDVVIEQPLNQNGLPALIAWDLPSESLTHHQKVFHFAASTPGKERRVLNNFRKRTISQMHYLKLPINLIELSWRDHAILIHHNKLNLKICSILAELP